jgi:hypothetical protein
MAICTECGVDTIALGEYYMVKPNVWERAGLLPTNQRTAPARRTSGTEILCVGCLERRLGRTLVASDFTAAPVNNPARRVAISDRLRDRLTANK